MATKKPYGFDESKFRPKQREAALLLVEKEFTDNKDKRTNEEIAQELGVSRKSLWNWDNLDQNFIAYKKYLSNDFMDTQVAFVYSKLLKSIESGSIRGIELFMKRAGDLANKQEVSFTSQDDTESFDVRRKELMERLNMNDEDSDDNESKGKE